MSPAASPGTFHHTVWRTGLFIPYSDERWLFYLNSHYLKTTLFYLNSHYLNTTLYYLNSHYLYTTLYYLNSHYLNTTLFYLNSHYLNTTLYYLNSHYLNTTLFYLNSHYLNTTLFYLNSHYLKTTFLSEKVEIMYFLNLEVKWLKCWSRSGWRWGNRLTQSSFMTQHLWEADDGSSPDVSTWSPGPRYPNQPGQRAPQACADVFRLVAVIGLDSM